MAVMAIIGGTGVCDPHMFEKVEDHTISTPYGEVPYRRAYMKGKEVLFLARHGKEHSILPHLINYRANIWALKKLGATFIISTTAVGSLTEEMQPGDFVITDQFIDMTKSRVSSFFEGGESGVVHVDVTDPYCKELREAIVKAGEHIDAKVHDGGTYVCTEGPRFETPAEIKMFRAWGGHTVGMTNVPEVVLANEAEIGYATISLITNMGAGISKEPLTHQEVNETMAQLEINLQKLILEVIDTFDVTQAVAAHHRLAEHGGFHLAD